MEQEGQVQEWIMDKMPDQLKLPFGLRARKAVVELIRRELGLKIAIRTMGDYLNRWGFSPQKPIKRAYDQNTKAVEKWLSEDYPTIKKQAQKDRAEIHWGEKRVSIWSILCSKRLNTSKDWDGQANIV